MTLKRIRTWRVDRIQYCDCRLFWSWAQQR